MSYELKIVPSARDALESCFQVYGQGDSIIPWIKKLTELASLKIDAGSIDISSILKDLAENGEELIKTENWAKTREFLHSAGFLERVHALYFVVSKRQPPV